MAATGTWEDYIVLSQRNSYNVEIFLFKPLRPKLFLDLKSSYMSYMFFPFHLNTYGNLVYGHYIFLPQTLKEIVSKG